MLNLNELSERIAGLAVHRDPLGDFLVWFRKASKDVHLWGDDEMQDVVSSIECVLSEYHFSDLDEDTLKKELTNVIIPFVPPFAANCYGDPNLIPTLGSNANVAVNYGVQELSAPGR